MFCNHILSLSLKVKCAKAQKQFEVGVVTGRSKLTLFGDKGAAAALCSKTTHNIVSIPFWTCVLGSVMLSST